MEARGLSFRYGADESPVFQDLNFRVESGEFICLLGHSGRGKTTLLRLVAGLDLPTSGELLVQGRPVTGPGMDRGMVFQGASLFPWMTLLENVVFGVRRAMPELSRLEARERAEGFLDKVALLDSAEKYPAQLSGGMAQRGAIARMLSMKASIWLFDEPFSALDPPSRRAHRALVQKLWLDQTPRRTILFVTHNVDEAVRMAERILFLGGGGGSDVLVSLKREETGRASLKKRLAELFASEGPRGAAS